MQVDLQQAVEIGEADVLDARTGRHQAGIVDQQVERLVAGRKGGVDRTSSRP